MLNNYRDAVQQTLGALFGWLLLWPLTFLVPRSSNRFVVIGRDGGKFLDNCKHFFIGLQNDERLCIQQQAQQGGDSSSLCSREYYESSVSGAHAARKDASCEVRDVVFLTDQSSVRTALKAAGCRVGAFSGPAGWWHLLRCGTAVVDSTDWCYMGRFTALRGARIVQLWHGVPLKRIELLVAKQIAAGLSTLGRLVFWIYRAIIGRHYRVDCLVSTSTFVAREAMMDCFNARSWPATGYPRNDVLLDERLRQQPLMQIGTDVQAMQAVREAKSCGWRVLLYAPTFRKHFVDPFTSGALDLASLERFAGMHDLLILVKLHPLMRQPSDCEMVGRNIVFVSPDSDIYPLMADVDLLVTDYSSIYFDFLLLDRPIVYFCQDLDDYIKDDRGFIFDYDVMTPGPKVGTQAAMESVLTRILHGEDAWHAQRERVRNLVFDCRDGSAVERLMVLLDDAR